MKLGPRQRAWVEALRSGKYKQGRRVLRNNSDEFCCLGVACDIYDSSGWIRRELDVFAYSLRASAPMEVKTSSLPELVRQYFGLETPDGDAVDHKHFALIHLNDNGSTFEEIADVLEKHPSAYFNEEV